MRYAKIKIDNSLTIQAYKYGWELHNNNGKSITTTYYCRLDHVCTAALDIMASKCKTLEEILSLLELAGTNMKKEVQKELDL